MHKRVRGFTVVEALIIIVIAAAIGFVGFRVLSHKKDTKDTAATANTSQAGKNTDQSSASDSAAQFAWQQTADGWRSTGTPPACPKQPMLKPPADLSKATSILYPGQTRGGNYKPHGGFRFDNSTDNKITVTAPIDGYVVRGARYLAEGEVQYTFDIMNNCGVMYRVGHLRVLPADMQKIADAWPQPVEGDSHTENVNPPVYVKQGTVLATTVGIIKDKNTFFDWGVYDFRQANDASKSSTYQSAHQQDKELAWHAVCWFDWLPASGAKTVKGLPAGDPTSGKNSDYCKQ
jgi:type II secretory pathway pseudopilin PulG